MTIVTRGVRRGFTLVETLAVVGVLAFGGLHISSVHDRARMNSLERQSANKLSRIGQGHAMYALDNGGRIATYTWRGGKGVFFKMPDGTVKTATDDLDAAGWQNTEILMRRTGRIEGPDRFLGYRTLLPHTRLVHLPLMDYMNVPFPARMFADPGDAALMMWQSNPTDLSAANGIPYAGPVGAGYTTSQNLTPVAVRQRWAFSSSYLSTTSAWQPDGLAGEAMWAPISETPHLVRTINASAGRPQLAQGRSYTEVFAPSGKVHMFEEFDRRQPGQPYFAYDHARPLKLMFDGAVNNRPSGEANPSWNPAEPQTIVTGWRQNYVPLDQFPVPLSGLGEQIELSQWYRWTRFGLQGIDYTP